MHVRGIHVVFFIPSGGRQDDIRVQTGRGHTEIKCYDQIKLASRAFFYPIDFFWLQMTRRVFFVKQTVSGAQEVMEHVFVTFT